MKPQTCKAVFLPTDKSLIKLHKLEDKLFVTHLPTNPLYYIPQYIYILSQTDEIKEGDWAVHEGSQPFKVIDISTIFFCEKILATTDPKLISDGIASISESDIKYLIEKYNNKEVMEVEVECVKKANYIDNPEDIGQGFKMGEISISKPFIDKPKLNPDGSICLVREKSNLENYIEEMTNALHDGKLNLQVKKDSFTREEVIECMWYAWNYGTPKRDGDKSYKEIIQPNFDNYLNHF